MLEFKNCHPDQSAIIVGNGSSLRKTPLEKIDNHVTFGVNRISEIFNETSWRPDYYLFQGNDGKHERLKKNVVEVIDQGITTFIQKNKTDFFPSNDNVIPFNRSRISTNSVIEKAGVDSLHSVSDEKLEYIVDNFWSTDADDCVYAYSNSMIPLTQIAAYMGFNDIYFVGCDGYAEQQPHIIFKSGSNPLDYSGKYDSLLKTYISFLLSDKKPARSLVNGLFYLFLKSEFTPLWIKSKFKKDNYFKRGYTNNYAKKWKYEERNNKLLFVHKIIEKAGEMHSFHTYNATIEPNINIHTKIPIGKLVSK